MTEQTSTEQYDPAAHTVAEVNAHLESLDRSTDEGLAEFGRILQAEADRGDDARTTITGKVWPDPEPAQGGQNPAQDGLEPPTGDAGAPEPENGPQTGTKGATFAEAAKVIAEPVPAVGPQVTNTDRLADEGKTKGYTFAEQAEQARALYGTGNPADRKG